VIPRRQGAQALAGLRVLDLSRLLPGPFCSLLLADHGADVLKVEDTGLGDYMRWTAPFVEGVAPSAASAQFLALNRNKRSIRIDLKTEAGCAVLRALAAGTDVLLESFRPGVLDRLGVGYDVLRAGNPALVWCTITGYGPDGPDRGRPGHDLDYVARAGVLGVVDTPDAPLPVQVGDLGGGALLAAFGILAALRERDRSGEGQRVDIGMTQGALSWLAPLAARVLATGEVPAPGTTEVTGGLLCYRPYPCADGWVAFAPLEEKFWAAFCHGIGREDLLPRQFDPPGSPTQGELEAIFRDRTRDEWAAFADAHECCLEPVLDIAEAIERAPEMVVGIEQPGAAAPVRALRSPVRLSRTPADPARAPAPELGGDTEAVLAELGYGEEDIARLLAEGAVAGPAGDTVSHTFRV
jgi:crotonobetainyl-CoA:carnitine CoA-transferase CaiB-like acyl-CoA transferase